jgi:hypothetical protein
MAAKPPITLKEALETMEKGSPFNLVFFTADKKRKTGGIKKELMQCHLNGSDYANSIRRILKPNSDQVIDVHIRLMLYFNGRRIIY